MALAKRVTLAGLIILASSEWQLGSSWEAVSSCLEGSLKQRRDLCRASSPIRGWAQQVSHPHIGLSLQVKDLHHQAGFRSQRKNLLHYSLNHSNTSHLLNQSYHNLAHCSHSYCQCRRRKLHHHKNRSHPDHNIQFRSSHKTLRHSKSQCHQNRRKDHQSRPQKLWCCRLCPHTSRNLQSHQTRIHHRRNHNLRNNRRRSRHNCRHHQNQNHQTINHRRSHRICPCRRPPRKHIANLWQLKVLSCTLFIILGQPLSQWSHNFQVWPLPFLNQTWSQSNHCHRSKKILKSQTWLLWWHLHHLFRPLDSQGRSAFRLRRHIWRQLGAQDRDREPRFLC